jgi:hypothetical protein
MRNLGYCKTAEYRLPVDKLWPARVFVAANPSYPICLLGCAVRRFSTAKAVHEVQRLVAGLIELATYPPAKPHGLVRPAPP